MEKNLKLSASVVSQLLFFFKKKKKERIAVVYLKIIDGLILGKEFHPFLEEEYIKSSYKAVSFNIGALRKNILYAIENQYDGILLIHNHPVWMPFFSKGDINSLNIAANHLKTYGYPLLHGIGIITGNRMSTRFQDSSVKTDFCKKVKNYL